MFGLGIKDIIDILIIATVLYFVFRLLRRSGVVNLFWGILVVVFIWYLIVMVFQLQLTTTLLSRVMDVGVIAMIVIFQNELRTFFYSIGSRFNLSRISFHHLHSETQLQNVLHSIVVACLHMSGQKTGALIVITRGQSLDDIADTGEKIDSIVSARMLENIFFKNTPLHDGAVFIKNNRIYSAACILPISNNKEIPEHYGLRHRAALGLAEKTDALVLVVSEETGTISLVHGDHIRTVNETELEGTLLALLQ